MSRDQSDHTRCSVPFPVPHPSVRESRLLSTQVPTGGWHGAVDMWCGRDAVLNAGQLLRVSIDVRRLMRTKVSVGKDTVKPINMYSRLSHVCGEIDRLKLLRILPGK